MRRTPPAALLALCTVLGLLAAPGAAPASAGLTGSRAPARSGQSARPGQSGALPPRVNFHAWRSYPAFNSGTGDGVQVIPGSNGGLVISQPAGTLAYHDPFKKDTKNWAYSTWTTPVHRLDFGATELVSSWDAHVPQRAWLRMQLQATMQNGQKTRWLDMGNYAYSAGHLWVVAGFTKAGNVVVNDPANSSDSTVRHVFNRRQFENVWLRTYWKRADGSTGYGSGGVAYIIWPHGMHLPPNLDPRNPAW